MVRRRHLLLELREDVLHGVLPLPVGEHLELVAFNLYVELVICAWINEEASYIN